MAGRLGHKNAIEICQHLLFQNQYFVIVGVYITSWPFKCSELRRLAKSTSSVVVEMAEVLNDLFVSASTKSLGAITCPIMNTSEIEVGFRLKYGKNK